MGRSCWHDGRLGLGVLLTLLACGILAPQVHAGCDYPTVVTASMDGASSSHRAHPLSQHSLPGPRSCTGTHCSRAPIAPPATPVTPITSIQESGCLPIVPGVSDFNSMAHRLEDDPRVPIFRTFRIYHPPR